MSPPLLEIKGLNKAFGKVVTARDLNLQFQGGVITSIIGPNGAGKSTLINVISGALPADSGQVLFQGRDISHLPIHARIRMGLGRSFQLVNVFPELTVLENVLIPVLAMSRRAHRFFSPIGREEQARSEALEVLARANLAEQALLPAAALSHGDRRLLEVAVALGTRPKLLFLDEPTAGMNPMERVEVLEHIKQLSQQQITTFVIVEHDMDVVFSLSHRVIVLHRGDVICDGGPDSVQGDEAVRECYLGQEAFDAP